MKPPRSPLAPWISGGTLALALLAAPLPCLAQAPPIYHFGEIVVTAERPRVVEQVTTVDVVTAEDVAASGARTLDEAIALLPGVFVRRGAEGVALIDVRGLRTRNVLLLLDGVPLNSSFDGLFDPATLPLEQVARIKLTRGASSVLYGPAGNAGVIDVVTRAAGDAADASLRLESGSDGGSDLQGQASFRRGDLGLVTAAAFHHQDHFELSDDFAPAPLEDGGDRLNSDREDRSLFAGLTWDATPATSWGMNVSYRGGERGKPPASEDSRTSIFAPRSRFERVDADSWSVHTGLALHLGPDLDLRPALFFNQTDSLTDAFDDERLTTQSAAGASREDATARTYGASLQLAKTRRSTAGDPRGLLTVGVDVREEHYAASGFELLAAGGGGGGGGNGGGGGGGNGGGSGGGGNAGGAVARRPIDEDRSVGLASLAVEYELTPPGRWSAVLGAGYALQERRESEDEDGLNLLLGTAYSLAPGTTLRAALARQVRFPTLRDLYALGRGNPGLEPERTVDYEVGVEHAFDGGSRLELTVFRIDAEDFIQGTPGEPLANTERVRRQGVELSGHHDLAWGLRLAGGYTRLDATNRSADADVETIQNQPEHKLALTLERGSVSGLLLRGEVLHVAGNAALSRTRPTRVMALDDYTVVGLRVSRSLRADRYRLVARLSNALDESYVESVGFPAPGRTVFLGLELRPGR